MEVYKARASVIRRVRFLCKNGYNAVYFHLPEIV